MKINYEISWFLNLCITGLINYFVLRFAFSTTPPSQYSALHQVSTTTSSINQDLENGNEETQNLLNNEKKESIDENNELKNKEN
jgi:hypothetical protein